MLRISLLGPLEVTRDGERLRVPGGRSSEVLVRLALDAGLLVRTDRLLDDLWTGDDALSVRRNTLQSKVARLRRALGEPSVVIGGAGGYRLDAGGTEVDALAVVHESAEAARLLAAGDDRGAADLSHTALERYRGDILPSAGDAEWVEPHRSRLAAARIALIETGCTARLRLDEGGEVIGELQVAVAEHPYHETLWELLITALYRVGRQADALATYQRVRTLMADELGLDLGPRLRQIEHQLLNQEPALDGPARPPVLVDRAHRTSNLPSLSADLVGRDADATVLAELLAAHRLVGITGSGGVGKTALAIAVGREQLVVHGREGRVWLARLESASTAEEGLETLLEAMGLAGGDASLFEHLKGAPTLVILDNCEHLVDAAAALAVRLLDGDPDLRILYTSQAPLDVEGERTVELQPLEPEDAADLFTRRSTRRGGLTRPDDQRAVLELCRSLDGLPLAIELAAARTKTLSIEEISRRLDDPFSVLSDPASHRPERRRALKATIRWSYELLFPDDQRGLWSLSTFTGGASLPAVESVLAALDVPPSAAIDIIGRLVSRSLVIVDHDEGSGVRYRLLDSIRAYALEALAEAGRSHDAMAAHAAWYRSEADASTARVRSSGQAGALAEARAERSNIEAALAWSSSHDPPLGLAIANGFGWAWVVLGDSGGARRILAALDAVGGDAPAPARASALLLAAWIEASGGGLAPARAHIALAEELAIELDDADLQARCSYYLAYVVSHQGEFQRAMELTERSRLLYEGLDRPWDRVASGLFAARAAISAMDEARGVVARAEVEHALQRVDDPWLHVRFEAMLGELARLQRRYDDAVDHIARAAETSRQLGFLQTEAYQLSSLGRAQCQTGDYETGSGTLAIAIEKAEAVGDLRMAALGRVHLGRVLRALGETERARRVLDEAMSWHRTADGGEQSALGECLLAAMDAEVGVPGAVERLRAILAAAQAADDAPVEVFALDALARAALQASEEATARDLAERAARRMGVASTFIADRDRVDARPRLDQPDG